MSKLASLAVAVLVWSACTLVAHAAELRCLTGSDPIVSEDWSDIRLLRSEIEDACPCSAYDGGVGHTRRDYLACVRKRVTQSVRGGQLRKQCAGTVVRHHRKSVCGIASSELAAPCIARGRGDSRVTCSIQTIARCVGPGRTACPGLESCIDAADTSKNGLIGTEDSGECSLRAADFNAVLEAIDAKSDLIPELISQYGVAGASSALMGQLESDPSVSRVERSSDGDTFRITFSNGLAGVLALGVPGTRSLPLKTSARLFAPFAHCCGPDDRGATPCTPASFSCPEDQSCIECMESETASVEMQLEKGLCLSDSVTFRDSAVTLSKLRTMSQAGFIHVATHGAILPSEDTGGAEQVIFYSGIVAKIAAGGALLSASDLEDYNKAGEGILPSNHGWVITPSFVRKYASRKPYPNSLVILSFCKSLYNDSMSRAFLDNGAGAIVGFSDTVHGNSAELLIHDLLSAMISNNQDVSSARLAMPSVLDPIGLCEQTRESCNPEYPPDGCGLCRQAELLVSGDTDLALASECEAPRATSTPTPSVTASATASASATSTPAASADTPVSVTPTDTPTTAPTPTITTLCEDLNLSFLLECTGLNCTFGSGVTQVTPDRSPSYPAAPGTVLHRLRARTCNDSSNNNHTTWPWTRAELYTDAGMLIAASTNTAPGYCNNLTWEFGAGAFIPGAFYFRLVPESNFQGLTRVRVSEFVFEGSVVGLGVCGNSLREGTEQCDGSDDAACVAHCRADCKCTVEEQFAFTGAEQSWTVPVGVTLINVDVRGAQGGGNGPSARGGNGGRVLATLAVTPGESLSIFVGGRGGDSGSPNRAGPGGFNGGGSGGIDSVDGNGPAGGGGGASDIRRGGNGLVDRVVVAGGGGGSECCQDGNGGAGGGVTGADGGARSGIPGGGGTQSSGGLGGGNGTAGEFGQGGIGGNGDRAGGGGGGGWFGGGGGSGATLGNGGGGGSGYPPSAVHAVGYQAGDGSIVITYTQD